MKKMIPLFLVLTMVVGLLAGCGKKNAAETGESDSNKLSVVTTIFPEYDWVKEILGDKAESTDLTMLLDNGVDLHSYQPTADDIVKISDCDLFVYVGGESDKWVDDALKEATNKDMKVIDLLEVLGDSVKTEETVEGMQETEHAHDHSKEVSTFEDHEVQDRSLSDWAGSWQSAYPFALDGTLDDAFAAMAEEGEMTADEYKTYYQNGYKTDITNINIEGDHIAFTYEDGKKVGSDYKYIGYYIQNWSTGTKAAMYRFEAVDRTSGAPIYIEFNDHMIESAAPEHFHIRMSNESFDAIVDPEKSWPTFFPADMTGEDLCEHMEGHDHEHEEEADEHVWLSLKNAKTLVTAIADALQELDPDNKDTYAANTSAYIEKLSALDGAYQSAVDGAARKTVLFGDRFPFRYLVDDYGLSYYAAFAGCSAESEYFMMRSEDLQFFDVRLKGKYSFQYTKNMTLENCVLDTKDAFWHAEQVTVKNSIIKGEYLAWYSSGVTFIHCTIIGAQPFCYCKNLKLVDCKMVDTDLCFEKSEVNATITTPVISIKNPLSGTICAPSVEKIIMDDPNAAGEIVLEEQENGKMESKPCA